MRMDPESCRMPRSSAGLILGIGAILLGLVLLLEQIPGFRESGILEFIKNLWPLVLVGMGLAMFRRRDACHPARGWVMVAAGLLLLLVTLGHGRFDGLIGPGFVLLAGIFIVLRTLARHRAELPAPVMEDLVKGTAILSGFKHRLPSRVFKGAELTAIFGGFDLDLRQVVMEVPVTRIDVFVLFGGGELRVPEDWEVSIQATAIAGGVADKSQPYPEAGTRKPQLVVSGTILFGGIEVKR